MKEGNLLQISSYEMEDIGSYMNNTSSQTDTLNQETKQAFAPVSDYDLFVDGMKSINEKVQKVTDKIDKAEKVIINGTQDILNLEARLKQEAATIEIPTGFEINNTVEAGIFRNVTLNKTDGISVNVGNRQDELNADINSTINKTRLDNITSDKIQEQQELDNINGEKTNLSSIKSDDSQEVQELNFKDVIKEEKLTGVNTSGQTKENEIEFHADIEKVKANDI